MVTNTITVLEYTCEKCRYKWISRVNGKDRSKPTRCAKCKRWDWDKKAEKAKYMDLPTEVVQNFAEDFIRKNKGIFDALAD